MQRPIKFRAWEPDTKKMVDVYGINPMVQKVYLSHQQLFGTAGDDLLLSYSPDEEYSYVRLMQYTGLKDRHGVEIYEGDILSSPSMPNSPVEFQRGSFNAIYADGSHDEWEAPLWRYSVEVIGNIYEHPELLEANQ